MAIVVACIIFLNFIVAEVQATYAKAKKTVDAMRQLQQSTLVEEIDGMMPMFMRSDKK